MDIAPRDPSSGALATFAILAGPRFGEQIPVPAPVVIIGQGAQSDVVIADDSVSKVHARLEFEHGGWRLTDLESTNGTYVEGVRLAPEVPTPVVYGSTVRFGGVRLQFRAVETADPQTAREQYVAPAAPTPVAARPRGFRLPVWVVVLVLVALAVIAWFAVEAAGQPPAASEAASEAASIALRSLLPSPSPPPLL